MHALPVSQWVEVKPLSLQDASLWSARCELVVTSVAKRRTGKELRGGKIIRRLM